MVERWLGPDQPGFAAHVGFYPACQWLETYFDASGVTGAPILILAGELDSWGDGETCPDFAGWLNKSHSGDFHSRSIPTSITDSIVQAHGKDTHLMLEIGPVSFNAMPRRRMTAASEP